MLTFAIQGQGLKLSLPEGEEKQGVEKNIVIKVHRNNKLYLNDQQIEIGSLSSMLKEKLLIRVDKLVVIDSAPRVKYDFFARILDISREAGAENFSIIK